MSKFVIVIESGADLPVEFIEKYDIHVVPMHVSFAEETLDDMTFPVQKLFDFYEKTGILPKTSGCNPGEFEQMFDEIHAEYPDKHILHLAYSAITTCSYQSAIIAAEGRDYVTSIDTKQVTAGQSMIVLNIAEYLEENPDSTVAEITVETNRLIDSIKTGFIPGSLTFLRAGGRVSNAQYLGAKMLNLKPLIEMINGELVSTKKYRGNIAKVAKNLFQEFVEKYQLKKERVAFIWSTGLDELVKKQITQLATGEGFKEILWIETGCVITTHGGAGCFGIAGFGE